MCPHRSFSVASTASTFCWNLPLAVMDRSFGMVSAGMLSLLSLFCSTFLAGLPKPQESVLRSVGLSGPSLSPVKTEFLWLVSHVILGIKMAASHSGMLSPAQKSVPREVVQERTLSDHYRQWSKKTNSTVFVTTTSVVEVRGRVSRGA